MTIHDEIEYIVKQMDETDDFDTYLELGWQLNFLQQTLSANLEDFDLAT